MTNSHILAHAFEYVEPGSLEEALGLLTRHGPRARVLAGGTDLIVQMKMERLLPEVVVSIRRLSELKGIRSRDGGVEIGAGTTVRSVQEDPLIRSAYPALAEACAAFSTTQVQVMGTLGGNLCNGSPASDTAPVLIALEAAAVIVGSGRQRRVPLEGFFRAPGQTMLGPDELLQAVVVPAPRPGTGSAFLKMSRVAADIAKVNAAVVLEREGERVVRCRLAFGAVAPTPVRSAGAEAVLTGRVFSPEAAAEAARVASEEVAPIDDVRSTAWYRREMVRVLGYDGLLRAWERAGESAGGEALGRAGQRWIEGEPPPPCLVRDGLHQVEVTVNGVLHRLWVKPNELLLNLLRERLELTGTKYACGIGECGACTVEVDARPVLSCLVLAVSAHGSQIVTVEGLARPDGSLDPLQEAFVREGAVQCGYCTPGMLMTARSLLRENPHPSEEEVRDHLKGNLCRCTGYARIVRAVMGCTQ